jgi:predicted lipoprotein with Yx(FWY)xxD motif
MEKAVKRLAFLTVPVLVLISSAVVLAQSATLGVNSTPTLGSYLTTPNGNTLYTFNGDSPGVSNVTGQLAVVWPPFSGSASLPTGVSGTLSTITRGDGTTQVTFDGMPLYTFTGDTGPGVVNGQGGAGGRFFVATVQAVAKTATSVVAGATPAAVASATPAALPSSGESSGSNSGTQVALLVGLALGALGLGAIVRARAGSR